jgi:hypothetical protein
MHVRVCRECGEEYRPDAARCADCGGELEDRWGEESAEAPGARRAPPAGPADPAVETEIVHASAYLPDLTPLADALVQAGIGFRLLPRRALGDEEGRGFVLAVAHADRDRALEILAPQLAPDAADSHRALQREFHPEQGYARCPACGAGLRPGLPECPECGLGLAGDGE